LTSLVPYKISTQRSFPSTKSLRTSTSSCFRSNSSMYARRTDEHSPLLHQPEQPFPPFYIYHPKIFLSCLCSTYHSNPFPANFLPATRTILLVSLSPVPLPAPAPAPLPPKPYLSLHITSSHYITSSTDVFKYLIPYVSLYPSPVSE
jgi:hypothetical protein